MLVGDDVELFAALHDRIRLQAQFAVSRALAGLDVVFVAVPRAHEMRLVGGEFLAEPALVRRQHVLDLMHDDAFASWAALMQAEIPVGVEIALPMEPPISRPS